MLPSSTIRPPRETRVLPGRPLARLLAMVGLLCLVDATSAQTLPSSGSPARTNPHAFTNRLIHEKSPYLLLHAHNPVDWYPWGEEAFAKARRENKPIRSEERRVGKECRL